MTQDAPRLIRKAAVLGAGVMGAQIAAHLTNANIETLLFDLPSKDGDINAIVLKAQKTLLKLKPKPLASDKLLQAMTPANYDSDLELLSSCDLIIEAVLEREDIKESLYQTVTPFINDNALLVTNTSGISVNKLANTLPEKLRARFCGVHFFNPPRYMHLAELIPTEYTAKTHLDFLESFLVSTLGKGVVRAKDTPNFIANRIGVFSLLNIMHYADVFDVPFEVVDALTGTAIGRAKSGTFRTMDVVGLDTLGHVVQTMKDNLKDDPWHTLFKLPKWVDALIKKGALGQKSGAGVYKKQGKTITVLDVATGKYNPVSEKPDPDVLSILGMADPKKRFAALRASDHPQAQFLWSYFRDLFHYSAVLLDQIANSVRDVDLAMRWGFGWQHGPFETWQSAGWGEIANIVKDDIAAGRTLTKAALPDWVFNSEHSAYSTKGAYAPNSNSYSPRSDLPVYKRQVSPEPALGETEHSKEIIFENEGLSLWHTGDDIGVITFKTRKNTISNAVLDGLLECIRIAEQNLQGLVLWSPDQHTFSAGANLKDFGAAFESSDKGALLGAMINTFSILLVMFCFSFIVGCAPY